MVSVTFKTREELSTTTGFKLAETIGLIDSDWLWQDNTPVDFELNGTVWTAYTTRGRGRNSRTTYLHISRNVKRRIVDPEGNDIGLRLDDSDHMRGKLHDSLKTYKWVN